MNDKKDNASIKNRLSQIITSLSLDKEELEKICVILQERAKTAAEIEISNFQKNQQIKEKIEENKKLLYKAFDLKITITGTNGTELYGSIKDVFGSPNFPETVKSFYVNSETLLKALYNWYPRNSFDLLLDFSKPKVFDFSFMPSSSTPNNSIFRVQGYDTTWTNGVFSEIITFINQKGTPFSKVHKHSIYDILLVFLGFPLSFWACYKSSGLLERVFQGTNSFIKNAAYFYVFLAMLWVFRILFHYLRWVCPLVEFRTNRNRVIFHRWVLGSLLIAIIGMFIYDFCKFIF